MSNWERGTGLVNTKIMRQKIRITHFGNVHKIENLKIIPPGRKKSKKIGLWEPVGGVDFLNIRVNF